jgi:hypothetical protein
VDQIGDAAVKLDPRLRPRMQQQQQLPGINQTRCFTAV